ncbi:MAG: hypothetical protein CL840_19005 [Crocinitomicaceae bacterium]|nr:hypothetical protein [Crocinitomicaceae bacterium]|tara:strand:+ start:998 stop:1438 length:441 start_codon:yes stop_codon:yes gene_type:complete
MKEYFKHKMREKSPVVIIGMVLFGIVAITGLAILFGYILMSLWNWLMPMLFGLPVISYWQAVGLFILAKILFGFGGGSGSGGGKSHRRNKEHCRDKRRRSRDFSKWEHYDKFWEEKGEQAYEDYVKELNTDDAVEIIEEDPKQDGK